MPEPVIRQRKFEDISLLKAQNEALKKQNKALQQENREYSLSMHDIHNALDNAGHILDTIKLLKTENRRLRKTLEKIENETEEYQVANMANKALRR
jgi:hypothetical protein